MSYRKRKVSKKPAPLPDKPDFAAPPPVAVSLLLKMQNLRAMTLLTSSDATRYVLNGVLLEYDGTHLVLVSTDGCTMGILNSTDCLPVDGDSREPFAYIIPNELIAGAARLFTGKDASVWVEFDAKDGVSISAFDKTLQGKRIDGNYPKWRDAVPTTPPIPAANVNVNAVLLNRFAAVAKVFAREPYIYVRGHDHSGIGAEHGPLTVRLKDDAFLGIIMPVRATETHIINGVMPDWAKRKAA